jgi:hypothetical protein
LFSRLLPSAVLYGSLEERVADRTRALAEQTRALAEANSKVATILGGAVRGTDLLCRYGGEEFAVILL